jgi:hypothetical protein
VKNNLGRENWRSAAKGNNRTIGKIGFETGRMKTEHHQELMEEV